MELEAAKKRQGRPGKERSSKLDEQEQRGRSDAKVAEAVGMRKDTYRKAAAVVQAAAADPEAFGGAASSCAARAGGAGGPPAS